MPIVNERIMVSGFGSGECGLRQSFMGGIAEKLADCRARQLIARIAAHYFGVPPVKFRGLFPDRLLTPGLMLVMLLLHANRPTPDAAGCYSADAIPGTGCRRLHPIALLAATRSRSTIMATRPLPVIAAPAKSGLS